jgi:glycogen debranching enzyme
MAAILRGESASRPTARPFQRVFAGPVESTSGEAAVAGGRRERLVRILDGYSPSYDASGDIEASLTDPTGLFSFDTRFLSKWILTLDGERLNPLSVDDLQYFETRFFLVPGTGTVYVDAKLSVIRRRAVGDGFHEELTILNHDEKPVDITVRLEAASDFADLFEVKDALQKKGTYSTKVDNGSLRLDYNRETYHRRDHDFRFGAGDLRRDRGHALGAHRAARRLDLSTSTSSPRPAWEGPIRSRNTSVREGTAQHGSKPREMARRCATGGVRLGAAEDDVPA